VLCLRSNARGSRHLSRQWPFGLQKFPKVSSLQKPIATQAAGAEAKAVWTKQGFEVSGVRAAAFIPEVKKPWLSGDNVALGGGAVHGSANAPRCSIGQTE